jgi:hypothetical protein
MQGQHPAGSAPAAMLANRGRAAVLEGPRSSRNFFTVSAFEQLHKPRPSPPTKPPPSGAPASFESPCPIDAQAQTLPIFSQALCRRCSFTAKRNNYNGFNNSQLGNGSSEGRNMVLTVLFVPRLIDSRTRSPLSTPLSDQCHGGPATSRQPGLPRTSAPDSFSRGQKPCR